ncbi:hypothetical protein PVK06_022427 [Gossypium arboreum]|uniref:Uncharacterized protein n=1 Tax=Gossypium arboreum TaxID=29729 RepID=A0ABR0P8G1_GOSAR|nr:hypothetical protein PVK06_022427 [Gossypium arboreum]
MVMEENDSDDKTPSERIDVDDDSPVTMMKLMRPSGTNSQLQLLEQENIYKNGELTDSFSKLIGSYQSCRSFTCLEKFIWEQLLPPMPPFNKESTFQDS